MRRYLPWLLALLLAILAVGGCTVTDPEGNITSLDPAAYPLLADPAEPADTEGLRLMLEKHLPDGILSLEDNGRITYHSRGQTQEEPMADMTDGEAAAKAESLLAQLELKPDGGYRTEVSRVIRREMDLTGGGDGAVQVLEYTVCFYRTYRGIDLVSDREDGILLSFNDTGVTELRYFWRELKTQPQAPQPEPLTAEAVEDTYYAYWQENHPCCEAPADPVVTMAYLQLEDTVRAVWVFSEEEVFGNPVFIDMYTGEVLPVA